MATKRQIEFIESMAIDLGIWDNRQKYYEEYVGERPLEEWNHAECNIMISELKRMLRDKKRQEIRERKGNKLLDQHLINVYEKHHIMDDIPDDDIPF